ncbi:hypothetical protein [Endozoicomonas sp. SCSIO W0465]|uniref:hypothetical protein n=1 Tax=Endozoicomonas sp. SCSIO W0465 TaxID=2918516 RepID=UPI00207523D4|nr:hypothetical protein [Endozoicomonas sp. SCSIO W0465]USE34595.1 hypothetical protein MJO57_20970 [Endozoicomonas sp. SCSIO W0465]
MNKEQALSQICSLAKDELITRQKLCNLQAQTRELVSQGKTHRSQLLSIHNQYHTELWKRLSSNDSCAEEVQTLYNQQQLPETMLLGNILIEINGDAEDESDVCVTELEQLASPFEGLSSKAWAVMTVALENYQLQAEGDSLTAIERLLDVLDPER